MRLDKQFVLDELRKEGQSDQVQKAIAELSEKIDHDQRAALLQKFGLDPGKLGEKAVERGVATTKHLPPCPSCGNGEYETVSGGDSVQDPYPDN
jgi:hypothetical protein